MVSFEQYINFLQIMIFIMYLDYISLVSIYIESLMDISTFSYWQSYHSVGFFVDKQQLPTVNNKELVQWCFITIILIFYSVNPKLKIITSVKDAIFLLLFHMSKQSFVQAMLYIMDKLTYFGQDFKPYLSTMLLIMTY